MILSNESLCVCQMKTSTEEHFSQNFRYLLIVLQTVSSLMSSQQEKGPEVSDSHHHFPSHSVLFWEPAVFVCHKLYSAFLYLQKKHHMWCLSLPLGTGNKLLRMRMFLNWRSAYAYFMLGFRLTGRLQLYSRPQHKYGFRSESHIWSSSTHLILKRWRLLLVGSLCGGERNHAWVCVIPGLGHFRGRSVWAPHSNWQCSSVMLLYWFSVLCCLFSKLLFFFVFASFRDNNTLWAIGCPNSLSLEGLECVIKPI